MLAYKMHYLETLFNEIVPNLYLAVILIQRGKTFFAKPDQNLDELYSAVGIVINKIEPRMSIVGLRNASTCNVMRRVNVVKCTDSKRKHKYICSVRSVEWAR